MKILNPKFKKGLTLIELIVYISIVSIVLVALISLTTNLVYSQKKSLNSNEVGQNLNLTYQRLVSSIENAKTVSGTYPGNQLSLVTQNGTVAFSLSGNALMVSENNGPMIPLTNSKVMVSPPLGGQIFTKITNGNAVSFKINISFSETLNITNKETLSTSVLMRGK